MLSIALPETPKVVQKDEKKNYAVIEIPALYPGYGATIGNTLRRVLYSSLPGAAITSVKIEGVSHEFSTKEGVLEDILELTLNLKGVRLILHGDDPQTITLKTKGKKEVTAKDIDTPSQVEVVNKDAHIATLTNSKASLEMEMQVERGLGYVAANQDEKEKKEIGVVHLDAIFTPISKVNFEVENMRVGDRTDYNRLLLHITTDGTITPEQAFAQAIEVMVEHFKVFSDFKAPEPKQQKGTSKTTKQTSSSKSSSSGKKSASSSKSTAGSKSTTSKKTTGSKSGTSKKK